MRTKHVVLPAVSVLILLFSSAIYAQTEGDIIRDIAEAIYQAGDDESPRAAVQRAKEIALRKFVEKVVGAHVRVEKFAENTRVVYSMVDIWAVANVRIDSVLSSWYDDYTAHYRADVHVERKEIANLLSALKEIETEVVVAKKQEIAMRIRHRYAVTGVAEDMVFISAEKGEPSFHIDRHPVSVLEYQRFEAGYHSDKHYLYAATGVDWNHATEYCRSRGLRLPTDIEWERALTHADSLFGGRGIRIEEEGYRYEWLVEPVRKVYISAPIYKDMVRYPMKDLSEPWKLKWFGDQSGIMNQIGFRCVSSETPVESYVDTAKSQGVIPSVDYSLFPDYSLLTFTKVGSSRSGSFFLSIPLDNDIHYPPKRPYDSMWNLGFGASYVWFNESGEQVHEIEVPVIARWLLVTPEAIRFIVTPSAGLLVALGSGRELGVSYGVLVDVGLGHYAGPFLGIGYQGYYPRLITQKRGIGSSTFRGVVFRAGIEFPSVWWWF